MSSFLNRRVPTPNRPVDIETLFTPQPGQTPVPRSPRQLFRGSPGPPAGDKSPKPLAGKWMTSVAVAVDNGPAVDKLFSRTHPDLEASSQAQYTEQTFDEQGFAFTDASRIPYCGENSWSCRWLAVKVVEGTWR